MKIGEKICKNDAGVKVVQYKRYNYNGSRKQMSFEHICDYLIKCPKIWYFQAGLEDFEWRLDI